MSATPEFPDAVDSGGHEFLIDPELLRRAGNLGVEIMPTQVVGGGQSAEPVEDTVGQSLPEQENKSGLAETVMDQESKARMQLIELTRSVYDYMRSAGTFSRLSRVDQRGLLKLARLDPDESRDFFGAKVNELRQGSGLTKERLADAAGKSPSSVTRLLDGSTHPALTDAALVLSEIDAGVRQTTGQPVDPEYIKKLLVQFQRERFQKYNDREPNDKEVRGFKRKADREYDRFFA